MVPEKGKGIDKPVPLAKLGVNAVALRFLTLLTENTIRVKVEDFYITLPNPVNFALHKMIIFQRRLKKEKAIKDRTTAIEILKALIIKGETAMISRAFDSLIPKWQTKVLNGLKEAEERDILNLLVAKKR